MVESSIGRLLFAALIAGAMAGCYPKSGAAPGAVSATSVAWATAKWPDTTPETLAKGNELFTAKCNGCHGYPDLAPIADEKWPKIVDRMGNHVDFDAKQKEAVLRFILASKHS
jgi:cytochrome c5